MVRIGKKQFESMNFILSEFVNTHSGEDGNTYDEDLKVARNIINKIRSAIVEEKNE
jgi:hypothetical protein